MFKSISRCLALAMSIAVGACFSVGVVASPVVYTVAAGVYGATSHRLELTLQHWRGQPESQSLQVRSDLRADGHGFVFAALPKPSTEAEDATT